MFTGILLSKLERNKDIILEQHIKGTLIGRKVEFD